MSETQKNSSDDFDTFLSKIEHVRSIINDISSSDINISKKGIERADEYLDKSNRSESILRDKDGNSTIYSKTSLNKKVLEEVKEATDFSNMSPEEFMAAAEKDAKERYKRKL